jgi:hypothetical protein
MQFFSTPFSGSLRDPDTILLSLRFPLFFAISYADSRAGTGRPMMR